MSNDARLGQRYVGDGHNHLAHTLVVFSFEIITVCRQLNYNSSKLRVSVKSAFSTNAQSRYASAVSGGVLGPLGA